MWVPAASWHMLDAVFLPGCHFPQICPTGQWKAKPPAPFSIGSNLQSMVPLKIGHEVVELLLIMEFLTEKKVSLVDYSHTGEN